MKTIQQFLNERWLSPDYRPGFSRVEQWLQEYSEMVIDTCAENADMCVKNTNKHMGKIGGVGYVDSYTSDDEVISINKESILNVKKQL